jgi:hypothetical protein
MEIVAGMKIARWMPVEMSCDFQDAAATETSGVPPANRQATF